MLFLLQKGGVNDLGPSLRVGAVREHYYLSKATGLAFYKLDQFIRL